MPNYVRPKAFAQVTGLSLTTVRRRLDDGTLPAIQPGGPRTTWLIDLDAFTRRTSTGVQGERSTAQQAGTLVDEGAHVAATAFQSKSRPRWLIRLEAIQQAGNTDQTA